MITQLPTLDTHPPNQTKSLSKHSTICSKILKNVMRIVSWIFRKITKTIAWVDNGKLAFAMRKKEKDGCLYSKVDVGMNRIDADGKDRKDTRGKRLQQQQPPQSRRRSKVVWNENLEKKCCRFQHCFLIDFTWQVGWIESNKRTRLQNKRIVVLSWDEEEGKDFITSHTSCRYKLKPN